MVFPQPGLEKLGPVLQDKYEVEKVIEYGKAARTGVLQYKVRCLGYALEDDRWIDVKGISTGILQDFWTKGSLEKSFKRLRTENR